VVDSGWTYAVDSGWTYAVNSGWTYAFNNGRSGLIGAAAADLGSDRQRLATTNLGSGWANGASGGAAAIGGRVRAEEQRRGLKQRQRREQR